MPIFVLSIQEYIMHKYHDVYTKVSLLLDNDKAGHGMDHINRVYEISMKFCKNEGGNPDIVALAALLHDVDDYKLFGEECSKNLTNASRIMDECGVDSDIKNAVKQIISRMGYSKLLAGIRPTTLEGQIVSDADMCDASGATGLVRLIQFAAQFHGEFFDKNVYPRSDENLTAKEYKSKNPTTLNHLFEKILRLNKCMFTESGKVYCKKSGDFIISFLHQYFIENNVPEWEDYLNNYLNNYYL